MNVKKWAVKDWALAFTTFTSIGMTTWAVIETQLQKYGVIKVVNHNIVTPGLPMSALRKPPLAHYVVPPKLLYMEPPLRSIGEMVPHHFVQLTPPPVEQYHLELKAEINN